MKRFIAIWILLSAGLNIWQSIHIKELEEKRPMLIYKADNQGAEIFGKVVEKVVYKESPTARLPDYFNNNNEGKIIKWKQSRRFRGGRN